jgi:Ca2+-binding EF-hand superfamily protein
LTEKELAEALLSLGIPVNLEGIREIFSFFDPNDSGSIHYGEFLWSFFNRRKFVKGFSTTSNDMSYQKKLALFHTFDKNGNGHLNKKEFAAFVKAAGIQLSSLEIDLVFQKFDIDKSGDISMEEFELFLQDEVKRLSPELHKERVINPKAHLSFNKSQPAGKSKSKSSTSTLGDSGRYSPTSTAGNQKSKAATAPQRGVNSSKSNPRLSETEPIRARPASASVSASSSRLGGSSRVGSRSLDGDDSKLVESISGITGNNPLLTKSLGIPNKLAYSSARGSTAERFAGSSSVGHDNQEDRGVTSSLRVVNDR